MKPFYKSSWFNCKFSLLVIIYKKKVISLMIIRNEIERRNLKYFSPLRFGKNVLILEISGRLLNGLSFQFLILFLVNCRNTNPCCYHKTTITIELLTLSMTIIYIISMLRIKKCTFCTLSVQ